MTIRGILKSVLLFLLFCSDGHGALAGGRPNAFSGGQNAFAGAVNPANAVWIEDRFDVGGFWLHQKSSLDNKDNNPLFLPGKTDLTYKTKNLFTGDMAIHKKGHLGCYEGSISLATYTTPNLVSLRTKEAFPIVGTTPIRLEHKIQAVSLIFSLKYNAAHSFGVSVDYFYFSHLRNGFQRSDNALRSVSPGHVTNNGMDHSGGIGMTIGWRWNITKALTFGAAFAKKSYTGQFRKYRGYEPHHAKNYIPASFGAGFNYQFSPRVSGRLEVLWSNLGNLPSANNNVLPDGSLNLNKRGSNKSPGPGTQDATYINFGMGYLVNPMFSLGAGLSHRIKLPRKSSNFLSRAYMRQVIYDLLSLGANFNYLKHDFFFSFSYGFNNRITGKMPAEIRGGKFVSEKQNASLSISWGYRY